MRDLRWWLLIPYCFLAYLLIKGKTNTFTRKQWLFVYVLLSSIFFASGITKFNAFEFNGVDFSVFDWMLHNSINGHFFWSPVCECNHFGVHPTWLMTILIPLHYVWQSPWLLVISHALSLAVSLPLITHMLRLKMSTLSDIQIALILCAVTASQFIGSVTNYGFHYEVWYIPLGIWLLNAWHSGKRSWIFAAFLVACVKEDGALYLAAWSIGFIICNDRRKQASLLCVASVVFFFVNTKLIQPLAWSNGTFMPSWLGFWQKYGYSTSEIIVSAVNHPSEAIKDIFTSGIWHWLIPFAVAPLFSITTIFALAPGVIMLGLSSVSIMRGYGIYYAAPLIPFALISWVMMLNRLQIRVDRKKFTYIFLAMTLLLGFVGGVGPRLGKLKPGISESLTTWLKTLPKEDTHSDKFCVQTALYPHMGYPQNIRPLLSSDCGPKVVIHSELDPYPFNNKEELLHHAAIHKWLDLATVPSKTSEHQTP